MKVTEIWRYPVKTMAGESLQRIRIGPLGMNGDRVVNESAARSLLEGLEETLTLHRLGVFPQLGLSLKTTNCFESLNSLAAQRVGKVDHWRTSDQKQRWLAAALLDIEPRLRRIKGFRALPLLRQALRTAVQGGEATAAIQAA